MNPLTRCTLRGEGSPGADNGDDFGVGGVDDDGGKDLGSSHNSPSLHCCLFHYLYH